MAFVRGVNPLFLVLALTGCSLAGGPSTPHPPPRPESGSAGRRPVEGRFSEGREASPGDEAEDIAVGVVETAFQAIGTPYAWGGTGANGYDCSGLIRYAYGEFGIQLPRISRDQLQVGAPVEPAVGVLKPGDVLGFSAVVGGEATHVGLYVGDGQFIHSSTSGVRISNLTEPYWQQHFMAARRIVN